MGWLNPRVIPVISAVAVVIAPGCREPTEITVLVSTDLPCENLLGLSITSGNPGEIDSATPGTVQSAAELSCDGSGSLGSIVLVPSGSKDEHVSFRIVLADSGGDPRSQANVESCVPAYGKGCIVARRSLRYIPHTPLRVSVPLRGACDGVPCSGGPDQTCVNGVCVGAGIQDPGACADAKGCGENALGGGTVSGTDAGSDGPAAPVDGGPDGTAPTVYNQMNDPAKWSIFDVTSVSPNVGSFAGATFDGHYLYLSPYGEGAGGVVARYDTTAAFTTPTSWSAFDTTSVNPNAKGFYGAAFDGRYVFLVPFLIGTNTWNGTIARYDTNAAFDVGASWSTFATNTVSPTLKGFWGAAFDGRYLYLAPTSNGSVDGVVARYDTQAPFALAASWSSFDTTTVDAKAKGYNGAVFDGQYVYFVPSDGGSTAARYDTTAPFSGAASWSTFDTTTVNANAKGFVGALFDGRFVYLVPHSGSTVARFDARTPASMPALPGFVGSFL